MSRKLRYTACSMVRDLEKGEVVILRRSCLFGQAGWAWLSCDLVCSRRTGVVSLRGTKPAGRIAWVVMVRGMRGMILLYRYYGCREGFGTLESKNMLRRTMLRLSQCLKSSHLDQKSDASGRGRTPSSRYAATPDHAIRPDYKQQSMRNRIWCQR